MPIKSFRGLIADNSIDTITLHTNNGSMGYRIKKFQIMLEQLGAADCEHVVQIYSVPQTTVANPLTNDFNDTTLLGVAMQSASADARFYPEDLNVIFDNMVFNQDIYVVHNDNQGSSSCNYYIELEQVKLDLSENTVATLKDIRNIASQ